MLVICGNCGIIDRLKEERRNLICAKSIVKKTEL